ncbi:MAG TPA: RagB/SusD family nutrient uptake outer membrane protein [Candidatus Avimuribaculum pullicola]|nr:RagB/SusD family nutrient uptake outer membrane protein [Candidatus Avimuribaculum pullicola]
MKSLNKIFSVLGVSLALGLSSCVGDLDLLPNDPNQLTADKFAENPEEYIMQVMAKCYSGMAVSGQTGPDGSSDISGLDGGTSQYTRALYMLQEFTTDESKWIWPDAGVVDLVTNTWGNGNVNIFGTYSRLYVHIAICNDFLRLANSLGDYGISPDAELQATIDQYKLEARALRAMSYYWALDLFGNASFIDETSPAGTSPVQYTRQELYDWLVTELEDLVATFPTTTPIYGRVGIDGVEALLARVYLNAEVYTGTAAYDKCSQHCANIIARHQGEGFRGSGLVPVYMYLFCGDNDEYMPGGGGVNEILWGIPYDSENIQPYGGSMFLCAAGISNLTWDANDAIMTATDYGMSAQWGCMHATSQFSDKFQSDRDLRWAMWCKEQQGFSKANTNFSTFTDGYGVVKFTNLLKGNVTDPSGWDMNDNTKNWSSANGGIYATDGSAARADNFPDTDLPLIRLADVYLMYTEAYIMGHAGDATNALNYVNLVRARANETNWTASDLTADNILDERCRELYWELTRRSDLVRHGKFSGSAYNWSWKNNEANGASIAETMDLFPIPANVISAQPEFEQNPGY